MLDSTEDWLVAEADLCRSPRVEDWLSSPKMKMIAWIEEAEWATVMT